MDSDETFSFQTPSRVAVTRRSSPFIRRLSSRRTEPSLQACVARRRKLSWVTLQGRLIGVDEATSAQYVGPGLNREEAVAWELFSPLQRVLLVALVAAAEAKSKAFQKIKMLQRSVDLRDEILRNMQLKLECLSEEMNAIQDQSIKYSNLFISQKSDLTDENKGIITEIKQEEQNEKENERYFTNLVEQEERRMSDLSDFCWSVASSFDNNNQLNCEKEIYNLQKECNEKDEKIKELLSSAKLSTISDSKRIAELQEVVKRKNLVISKLKKDMSGLKQMVADLTRSKRVTSIIEGNEIPVMINNVLYDMSSSSNSESESESESSSPVKELVLQHSTGDDSRAKLSKNGSSSGDKITRKERKGIIGNKQNVVGSNESFKKVRRQSKSMNQKRWV